MSKTSVRIVVPNTQGIHMRPATSLINLANRFASSVEISNGKRAVNGKSIMEVLTLGAAQGTVLEIRVEGPDADEAMNALVALVESGFGES